MIREKHQLMNEDGWVGVFTRNQAFGAIDNGAVVAKINSKPTDMHRDGDKAVVLGSIEVGAVYGYFIEWEDRPKHACFITGTRLIEVK